MKFANKDLCKLTEQVIFTDPYYAAPVNRHTSPQLDDWTAFMRSDPAAKAAATALKVKILFHLLREAMWSPIDGLFANTIRKIVHSQAKLFIHRQSGITSESSCLTLQHAR